MEANWEYVKKTTLWQYEELLAKLADVLAYPFVQEYYNHSMPQAVEFARRLFPTSNWEAGDYPAELVQTFQRLEAAGIDNWSALLFQVTSREQCSAFVRQHDLGFEPLVDVLHYLLRWGLPFRAATRELLEHGDPQEMAWYAALKQYKLTTNLDLLELGRTPTGRETLANTTGLPENFVTTLVHRADISRLPFVRRKTILPVCGAGYDTLARIASADTSQMEADLDAYFQRTQGKPWADFKSVIVLRGLVAWARALPEVVR